MYETTTVIEEVKQINRGEEKKVNKWDIKWINVFYIALFHFLAIYGAIYYRPHFNWKTRLFDKTYRIIGAIGVTAGCHRYWCHRSYKASLPIQILLMIMSSINYVNNIYIWCRDHRAHHRYSDTNADPHNATRGLFFSHMGWLMVAKHENVKNVKVDMSDLDCDPVVQFQAKYFLWILLIFWVFIPIFVPMYFFGETFWPTLTGSAIYFYVVSVNHIWCINSLNHAIGNKPYNRFIKPVENQIMMVVGLGEGFHNYHHTFPWDYSASHLKFDFRNPTSLLIDTFAFFGLVYDRKKVPEGLVRKHMGRYGDDTYIDKPGNKKVLGINEGYVFNAFYGCVFLFYYTYIMP